MKKYFISYQYLYNGYGDFSYDNDIIEYNLLEDRDDLERIEIALEKKNEKQKFIKIVNIHEI